MQVEPVTLEGHTVRLEPLGQEHAEALWRLAEPDLFSYMWIWSKPPTLEAFRANIRRALETPNTRPFAIVLRETGQAVGSTSYLDIRPEHRGLEIGSTWLGKAYQGTQINPENKYLLLRHAFETLDALRVQLKTDGRNFQSRRAIEK